MTYKYINLVRLTSGTSRWSIFLARTPCPKWVSYSC